MRKLLASLLLTAATAAALAATGPYDEAADARAEIKATLSAAQQDKRPVLVVFGANWCGDCKVLDLAFKEGAAAPLIAKQFKVVKVDVGRFTKNTDIAEQYGVVLKKGIPAVAVLSAQGQPIYATRAGELADARNMGDKAIYEFFSKVVAGNGA
ncbi:MAG TPA: thioredoxin family protein [Roseateles sp.]|nr:thioredoxin family protein [Roseateles sp.]